MRPTGAAARAPAGPGPARVEAVVRPEAQSRLRFTGTFGRAGLGLRLEYRTGFGRRRLPCPSAVPAFQAQPPRRPRDAT